MHPIPNGHKVIWITRNWLSSIQLLTIKEFVEADKNIGLCYYLVTDPHEGEFKIWYFNELILIEQDENIFYHINKCIFLQDQFNNLYHRLIKIDDNKDELGEVMSDFKMAMMHFFNIDNKVPLKMFKSFFTEYKNQYIKWFNKLI